MQEDTELAIKPQQKKQHFGWIMTLYLLGLFIGAIGTGSITPVRTIIQSSLDVDDSLGIWMITIYTLCYAAIIPISGKLADRLGRKYIFLVSIVLFGAGSIVCGLSASMGSFAILLIGRVISAVGAGGIMPIATAEFGTSFPEEKRGMALGMVGAVYGIGNVLGATVGSAILDVFGVSEWQWIFYLNIPFCLFIIVAGFVFIPNNKSEEVFKIDKIGTLLVTVIILALLYGLKNLDFFDFANSITDRSVWPFLLLSAILIPIFVFVENRAEDAVFHIEYAKSLPIVITLALGVLVGCSMMGMIFIPQFAENALKISAGSGGYFVIILGLCAGVGSMGSGGMIDKMGAKPVMIAGFIVTILGCLYLCFITINYLNWANVIICLIIMGLGLGLTMGTPLNYMMMKHTTDEESNSALATLSLVRSIGTAVAPAIMVGFIVHAAGGIQDDLMKEMPPMPDVPKMEQQVELEQIMDKLTANEETRKQLEEQGIDIDSMTDMNMNMDMDFDMSSSNNDLELPDELLEELQNSDVTTITKASKDMARYMFDTMNPDVIADIQDGIGEGIDGIGKGIDGVNSGIGEMQTALCKIDSGRAGIKKGIAGISKGIKGASSGLAAVNGEISDMNIAIKGMEQAVAGMSTRILQIENTPGWENDNDLKNEHTMLIEERSKTLGTIAGMKQGLAGATTGQDSLQTKITKMKSSRSSMQSAYNKMGTARAQLASAITEMQTQRDLMLRAKDLMQSMSDDIPGVFKQVETDYLKAIDNKHEDIETVYQDTVNVGYRGMYLFIVALNILGLILIMFYKEDVKKDEEETDLLIEPLEKTEQAKLN